MNLNLVSIEIKNFYSYENVMYDGIKDYNVIIGKNNTGKSNLFKLFNLLKKNAFSNDIKLNDLFDENLSLDNQITLIFKIGKQLRSEIFKILYSGNYLNEMINYHKRFPNKYKEYQPYPKWDNKEEVFDWLLALELYNKLSLEIDYNKEKNSLIINKISVHHLLYHNIQSLFELRKENNREVAFILDLSKFNELSRSIEGLFKLNQLKKLPLSASFTMQTTIGLSKDDDTIKKHIPILLPVLSVLSNEFFNAIHIIPAKRSFDSDSDRDSLSNLGLSLDGKNLVKFIHKKAARQQWEWLREWNQDLRYFLDDIVELKQDIRENELATLILKEDGLNMDLLLESMGAGVLNIAHFLAYIKTLENPSIICIEEPELHLHPGLERELRNEFIRKSEKHQIFITTHSREFLDENEDKCSIFLINKIRNRSIVNKISNNDYKEIHRNLDLNLSQYEESNKIVNDNKFWKQFIKKAIEEEKYETELWDFKQFLEIWKAVDHKIRRKKKIEFCSHVSAFANNQGGVLILGISDNKPRKISGLTDIETKMNELESLIIKNIEYPRKFVSIKSIPLINCEDKEEDCIIINISQTEEPVAVKEDDGRVSYHFRLSSGKKMRPPREIFELKKKVMRDNINFLRQIKSKFQI